MYAPLDPELRNVPETGWYLLTEEQAEALYRKWEREHPIYRPEDPYIVRMRTAGLFSGHAWGWCNQCGVPQMKDRTAKEPKCSITPRCEGKLQMETTLTPRQTYKSATQALLALANFMIGPPQKVRRKKAA